MNNESIYSNGTYLAKNDTWHAEDSAWKSGQIKSMLSKNNLSPHTVCEVGCGAGEILVKLSERMPAVTFVGYEVSPQAFELCKPRQRDNIIYHLKDILSEDVFFYCLLCVDVFEHIEDYMGFLKTLKKAQYKIFHIPLDISVMGVLRGNKLTSERRGVGRLHYFTQDTALATLEDCGFELIDYFYSPTFIDRPSKSLYGLFAKFRYKLFFQLAPHFTVRFFGASSLLVLAK